jgi:signal transduction histidine kinase
MVAVISFALWIIYLANRNSELELSEKASELEALNNDLQEKNKEIIKKESKLQDINLLLQGHLKDMEIQQVLLTNANATKDKFFSIIAHDLKNPVSSIMGFAQILATKFDELDSEKVKNYTELLYDSSLSVNELMQNLLQWSRTQRGSIEIKKESFLIHPLLSKNTSLQKLAAEQKGLELEFSCPEDLRVFADYNMIDTAIRNLLSNAIKFTPKGGSIKLTGSQKEDKIVIAISDTGRGMDADEVKKLFLIDQSFSKEGTEGEKGTGLGLIIVKEFISKNEGQIRVESEKDRGTTFTISLPTNTPNN